jgi:hypothetical protein
LSILLKPKRKFLLILRAFYVHNARCIPDDLEVGENLIKMLAAGEGLEEADIHINVFAPTSPSGDHAV